LQKKFGYRVYTGEDGVKRIDVDPIYRDLLGVPHGDGATPPPAGDTPKATAKPRTERKPPPANAMGIVDKSKLPKFDYKGTPYNPGVKPTPRPENTMTFEEYLKKGQ
jgi:hypothetical protein